MIWIGIITKEEVFFYKKDAKKDGIDLLNINYIGYKENNVLYGFVGYSVSSKNKAIMRCDWVRKEYRKKGVYLTLVNYRIDLLKRIGFKKLEINCNKLSLPFHINNGAKVVKKFKHSTRLVYENI